MDPSAQLVLVGVVALVTALVFTGAFRARRRREFRARVLEEMAAATARGFALPPLLERAAASSRGRARRLVERMRARLDAGAPVSAACSAGGFPSSVVHAVRAAEGTDGLPGALAAAAAEGARDDEVRHRVLLALVYPVLILVVVFLAASFDTLPAIAESVETAPPAFYGAEPWVRWGAVGVGGLVLLWWFGLRRVLPPSRLRNGERIFAALCVATGTGAPIVQALERTAGVTGNLAAGRTAAERAAAGMPLATALAPLRLPRFTLRRVAVAPRPETFGALSDECARRRRARWDRALRWSYPIALVVCGALAALHFAGLLDFANSVRAQVMPW